MDQHLNGDDTTVTSNISAVVSKIFEKLLSQRSSQHRMKFSSLLLLLYENKPLHLAAKFIQCFANENRSDVLATSLCLQLIQQHLRTEQSDWLLQFIAPMVTFVTVEKCVA